MKKPTKQTRGLALSIQTVRALAEPALPLVVGGQRRQTITGDSNCSC